MSPSSDVLVFLDLNSVELLLYYAIHIIVHVITSVTDDHTFAVCETDMHWIDGG